MNPTLQALMDGAPLSADDTRRLLEQYPYFVYPAIRFALDAPDADPAALAAMRRRVAVNIGDTDALLRLFGPDPEAVDAEFYPDQATPTLDTTSTIDSFLARFGSPASGPAEEPLIPVEAPAVDYAAILDAATPGDTATLGTPDIPATPDTAASAGEPEASGSTDPAGSPSPSAIADSFEAAESTRKAPALSESLARIMIKNGNYAKALEIITDLRAKNPQKSIYFADQIRFLRKLIINDTYLQH